MPASFYDRFACVVFLLLLESAVQTERQKKGAANVVMSSWSRGNITRDEGSELWTMEGKVENKVEKRGGGKEM